ncbi:HIRAN domain-containing protein [Stappia sp. F7233]|uniref:HIRAN domain-containing protein n=1 Tax=Stappia albiluteola TaxID=2758565 RepID=A0A839AHL7_9HYPH|nr:HIRAN domain-containing protein [Stappia albiluteola]MBA5778237.1 HIRAN domain-containing protein [Stappia albiluteola]
MRVNFLEEETLPDTGFNIALDEVNIVGEEYYKRECNLFLDGILYSRARNLGFGIELVREPSNPHDELAIMVFGYWTGKSILRRTSIKRAHIGYIPRKLAYRIAKETDGVAPIAAALSAIETSPVDPINIIINIYYG